MAAKRNRLERAVRTFRKWHEFDPDSLTSVKGPRRVIPSTLVLLGELVEVVYRSDKWEGKKKLYVHKTKKPHPLLVTDPDGKSLYIVGGRVKVTGRGLVD